MKKRLFTILALCTIHTVALAQARYVTLQSTNRYEGSTNEITLASTETAELVYFPYLSGGGQPLEFIRNGHALSYSGIQTVNEPRPLVLTGPAVLRYTGSYPCTLKITPDQFSPDKTLIIPAGTTGATVIMECSTNLLTWTTATNGFYSATNTSTFFRIRAERVP